MKKSSRKIEEVLERQSVSLEQIIKFIKEGGLNGKIIIHRNDGYDHSFIEIKRDKVLGQVMYPFVLHINEKDAKDAEFALEHEIAHALFNIFFDDEDALTLWNDISQFIPERSDMEEKKLVYILQMNKVDSQVLDIYHALGIIHGDYAHPQTYYDQPEEEDKWNRNNIEEIYADYFMLVYHWDELSLPTKNFFKLIKSKAGLVFSHDMKAICFRNLGRQ